MTELESVRIGDRLFSSRRSDSYLNLNQLLGFLQMSFEEFRADAEVSKMIDEMVERTLEEALEFDPATDSLLQDPLIEKVFSGFSKYGILANRAQFPEREVHKNNRVNLVEIRGQLYTLDSIRDHIEKNLITIDADALRWINPVLALNVLAVLLESEFFIQFSVWISKAIANHTRYQCMQMMEKLRKDHSVLQEKFNQSLSTGNRLAIATFDKLKQDVDFLMATRTKRIDTMENIALIPIEADTRYKIIRGNIRNFTYRLKREIDEGFPVLLERRDIPIAFGFMSKLREVAASKTEPDFIVHRSKIELLGDFGEDDLIRVIKKILITLPKQPQQA